MAATAILAACTIATVETADPAVIPSGPPQAGGADPTGPIVELASGRVSGIGWRYLIYESADGLCTQFETGDLTTTGCGDPLPEEGSTFGAVAHGGVDSPGLRPIEGMVTDEVATVWLVGEDDGTHVPAKLMPLDEAGLEGQAFIGFIPEGATVTHLQAVKLNGEILETYELP